MSFPQRLPAALTGGLLTRVLVDGDTAVKVWEIAGKGSLSRRAPAILMHPTPPVGILGDRPVQ
ncbi:hypothetical protein ACFSSC_10600 [Corynebacterium mendelii]|uniref:Uncharacterized protein n=1 Tax=Corynebacterium mendelii TaxID=2765362 RepID=A0A939DZX4_9CORY|nr:hypothetical protein [Corynebacterium mendelii]MBN9644349.1 hypothetical protein [Corynebacterium mendelii]